MKLILASKSPRRKELLTAYNYKFEVVESEYLEQNFSLNPTLTATTFARGKAESVYNNLEFKGDKVVLGADTVVFHEGQILGKANSKESARKMLKSLSGREHVVITGYAIVSKIGVEVGYCESKVLFNDLSEQLIEDYLNSGLYIGKAGSYGIQDGYPLVKECVGSYNNVIGLPIEIIKEKLDRHLKG